MTKKGFFIDIQGTLIDDEKALPIDGAIEFINELNKQEIPYIAITNNTKQKSTEFLKDLKEKGLELKNYIDPFSLLQNELKVQKLAAFGTNSFVKILQDMSYSLDYENPEALVISIKKDYTNEDYAKMIECAIKSKQFIAMHETSVYSKDGKKYPGVGSIAQMIKFATNKEYRVVGKPSSNFYNKAREILNLNYEDIVIISDDCIGDLLGAKKLGMKTCLVLSGKIKNENEILPSLKKEQYPDFICKDMSEVLEKFLKGEI